MTPEERAAKLCRELSFFSMADKEIARRAITRQIEAAVAIERAACADIASDVNRFAGCEALGAMDPETGARECGAVNCPCAEKIEHGEEIAKLIMERVKL